jgi:Bacterial PH domain
MVSPQEIETQLDKIGFNYKGWGRTEVKELQNIILPDEEIYEIVNGIYEGGFALILATNLRVLLVDKKPLNYLTVEDLRFDMINELDYNHRLIGAYISISAGNKNLKFTSINQPRLRKLIGHVQRRMAEVKQKQSSHEEGQVQHLEQINQQLQSYLVAQYQQQQKLQEQIQQVQSNPAAVSNLRPPPEPVRPSPQLADYLYAQRLLDKYQAETGQPLSQIQPAPAPVPALAPVPTPAAVANNQWADLYSEGKQEVFGKRAASALTHPISTVQNLEINPFRIVTAILPQIVRSRKAAVSLLTKA